MPPKAKVTKDMIIDAAFEVARESGVENINARDSCKKAELFHAASYVSF